MAHTLDRVGVQACYQVQHLGWMASDGLYGAQYVTPVLNKSAWLTEENIRRIPLSDFRLTSDGVELEDFCDNVLQTVYVRRVGPCNSQSMLTQALAGPRKWPYENLACVQLGEARLTDRIAVLRLAVDERSRRIAHVHVYKCKDDKQALALHAQLHSLLNTQAHLHHLRVVEKEAYQKSLVDKCSDELFKQLSARATKEPVAMDTVRHNLLVKNELQSCIESHEQVILPPRDYDHEQANRNSLAVPTVTRNRTPSGSVYLPPPDYENSAFGDLYGQVTLRKPLPKGTWAQINMQRQLSQPNKEAPINQDTLFVSPNSKSYQRLSDN